MKVQAIKNYRLIEEAALFLVVVIALIGVGLTNISPELSYKYWLYSTIFYAVSGVVVSFYKRQRDQVLEIDNSSSVINQLILWAGTIFAILSLYLMIKIGRINYSAASLVIVLILGLSVFIDGISFSWRYSLIGGLMMFSALAVAYIVAYMWLVIGVFMLIAFGAFIVNHFIHKKWVKKVLIL